MNMLKSCLLSAVLLSTSGCSVVCGLVCTTPALPTDAYYAMNEALLNDLTAYYKSDPTLSALVLAARLEEIKGQRDFVLRARGN